MMLNLIWSTKKVVFDEELLNSLYRYALSLTHDEHLSYDLIQNSCEKILSLRDQKAIATPEQLKNYMRRIVKNDFIDQYRRKKLELVFDANHCDTDETLEQETSDELENLLIDKQHVAIILQQLTDQDRELLYLWAVEGNTVQELSDKTDIPRGTILSRLNRMKKFLQHKYRHLNTKASANE